MENKDTVIGTSTDMTWPQLQAIDDLNTVGEFITLRQRACLILAQESRGALLQLLLTDGCTNALSESAQFSLAQFAEWIDNHFAHVTDDLLAKCAYIATMEAADRDPFAEDEVA